MPRSLVYLSTFSLKYLNEPAKKKFYQLEVKQNRSTLCPDVIIKVKFNSFVEQLKKTTQQ